jgi:hypothetical protein
VKCFEQKPEVQAPNQKIEIAQKKLKANLVKGKECTRSKHLGGKIFRCPHTSLKHYAKGMCNHCYHNFGRTSLATNCTHKDRFTYAKGLCQPCYAAQYNKKREISKKK